MKIDDYTKLLPYDGTVYSPVKRLPKVGELAITLSDPRGYCCVVDSVVGETAYVHWLDDLTANQRHYPICSLIPTGKKPSDLLSLYEPTPQSLSEALERERQPVEFLAPRKKGGATKTKAKFDIKDMSKEQKDLLAGFIKQLMKGGDK